jgi:hypothetical protein
MKNINMYLLISIIAIITLFYLNNQPTLIDTKSTIQNLKEFSTINNNALLIDKIKENVNKSTTNLLVDLNKTNISIDSIEKEAIELFSIFGQIPTFENNQTNNKNSKKEFFAYKEIELFNLFDKYEEPLRLIILKDVDSNNIVGEVLFKLSMNKYVVSRFRNIEVLNYNDYPNLSFVEAEKIIRKSFKLQSTIALDYEQEFFHIEKKYFPVARFVSPKGDEYLINMNSGQTFPIQYKQKYIEAKEVQKAKEDEKELPLYLDNKTGEVILEVEKINRNIYSEEYIKELLRELEIENKAIREGLLKLDEDLNLIYDKR